MNKYIFDIDGTLTPSRQQIDPDFLQFMLFFAGMNEVYLVTGSDREKTLEQVGLDLYNSCKRVYNCSGADVYEQDKNVYRDDWKLPEEVERFLQDELDFSQFPIRNGNHIERRPGGINFSILGRDSNPMLGRKEYIKWDKETLERVTIQERLKTHFPKLSIQVGGQTGLDISNGDKSQILRDFDKNDVLYFFGDMTHEGGNDYPLAKIIKDNEWGIVYNVLDYKHTRQLTEELGVV